MNALTSPAFLVSALFVVALLVGPGFFMVTRESANENVEIA
ncbi:MULTISPECIES: hypothetical protein [Actinomyces]|nr:MULTISPECIES: hypothetical protein [Actinomyces]MDU6680111.1 hypothetical protein [Actinomyces sp.]